MPLISREPKTLSSMTYAALSSPAEAYLDWESGCYSTSSTIAQCWPSPASQKRWHHNSIPITHLVSYCHLWCPSSWDEKSFLWAIMLSQVLQPICSLGTKSLPHTTATAAQGWLPSWAVWAGGITIMDIQLFPTLTKPKQKKIWDLPVFLVHVSISFT